MKKRKCDYANYLNLQKETKVKHEFGTSFTRRQGCKIEIVNVNVTRCKCLNLRIKTN